MRRYAAVPVFFIVSAAALFYAGIGPDGITDSGLAVADHVLSAEAQFAIILFCACLSALAGWLVWWGQGLGPALGLWVVCLVANALWLSEALAQTDQNRALTFLLIAVAAAVLFVRTSWRIRQSASVLFVPVAAWLLLTLYLSVQAAGYLGSATNPEPEPRAVSTGAP